MESRLNGFNVRLTEIISIILFLNRQIRAFAQYFHVNVINGILCNISPVNLRAIRKGGINLTSHTSLTGSDLAKDDSISNDESQLFLTLQIISLLFLYRYFLYMSVFEKLMIPGSFE